MKQGQETNQIWTQEAGTDDTQQNPETTCFVFMNYWLFKYTK